MHHSLKRRGGFRGRAGAAGVGLVEVLIAILILSFGMLGLAAMQATTLRNSQSAMQRSQAVIQTYSILDAMRANLAVARIGGYNLPANTCTAPDRDSLPTKDLADWIDALHAHVDPNACGSVQCGSHDCTITVQWDDSRATHSADADVAAAEISRKVVTETRL